MFSFPLWSTPAIAAVVWALWFLERKFPAEREQSTAAVIVDWKLAGLRLVIRTLSGPLTAASGIMIVNAMGGGWIHLRSDGCWFLFSVVVVVLAMDFYSYLLHRAQHKIPVLWAMHSLHHSAEALSIITGARHFWLEDALNTAVFPVMGIIFNIPHEVLLTVAAIYLVPDGLFSHMNVRMSLAELRRFEHIWEPKYLNLLEPTPEGRHYSGVGVTGAAVILGGSWAGSSSFSLCSNRRSSASGSV
jgi:sterol desaturase/sphingolipid hydroxylase (fatty acid hydroxylase superfamily)